MIFLKTTVSYEQFLNLKCECLVVVKEFGFLVLKLSKLLDQKLGSLLFGLIPEQVTQMSVCFHQVSFVYYDYVLELISLSAHLLLHTLKLSL
jgi:hypothetical protein